LVLLLENGADINARGGEFSSALQGAVAFRSQPAVHFLLRNGADTKVLGEPFSNALLAAYARSETDISNILNRFR
jgi:ankyrin repeat protein